MLTGTRFGRFVADGPPWFQSMLLGLGVFVIFVLTAWYGGRQNTDTWAAAIPAWQLGQHGTLDLRGYDGDIPWRVNVGEQVFTNRFPGVILAATPFYALLGSGVEPRIYPGAVAAAFWSAAAVAICFAVCQKLLPTRKALAATLIFAFATPTWTVSADALWTHGPDQFWLLTGVLFLSASRPVLGGLSAAMTILIRPHMAVAWAGAGLYHVWSSRQLGYVIRFGLAASVGALLLIGYNWQVFNAPGLLGGYRDEHLKAEGVGWLVFVVNILGSLISPHRGVLLLTPFLWLLIPGLRRGWSTAPAWVRSSAVAGLTYALVQLYLIRFIGGQGFYSYRTMIEPLTFAVPLLVCSYRQWTAFTPGRRATFNALVALSLSFHAFGAILDRHGPESGNPFRMFSAIQVAQDTGPAGTAVWVSLTVACIAFVIHRSLRSTATDSAPSPVTATDTRSAG